MYYLSWLCCFFARQVAEKQTQVQMLSDKVKTLAKTTKGYHDNKHRLKQLETELETLKSQNKVRTRQMLIKQRGLKRAQELEGEIQRMRIQEREVPPPPQKHPDNLYCTGARITHSWFW